jgi:hypothetical protein
MKKSKTIQLVLITAALAGCADKKKENEWSSGESKTYVRADSTAPYTRTHYGSGAGALLWFYAFRPYGGFRNGQYNSGGYYSNAIPRSSNVGSNGFKNNITRSGFGRSGARASS